jgi:hypothetical protein
MQCWRRNPKEVRAARRPPPCSLTWPLAQRPTAAALLRHPFINMALPSRTTPLPSPRAEPQVPRVASAASPSLMTPLSMSVASVSRRPSASSGAGLMLVPPNDGLTEPLPRGAFIAAAVAVTMKAVSHQRRRARMMGSVGSGGSNLSPGSLGSGLSPPQLEGRIVLAVEPPSAPAHAALTVPPHAAPASGAPENLLLPSQRLPGAETPVPPPAAQRTEPVPPAGPAVVAGRMHRASSVGAIVKVVRPVAVRKGSDTGPAVMTPPPALPSQSRADVVSQWERHLLVTARRSSLQSAGATFAVPHPRTPGARVTPSPNARVTPPPGARVTPSPGGRGTPSGRGTPQSRSLTPASVLSAPIPRRPPPLVDSHIS